MIKSGFTNNLQTSRNDIYAMHLNWCFPAQFRCHPIFSKISQRLLFNEMFKLFIENKTYLIKSVRF